MDQNKWTGCVHTLREGIVQNDWPVQYMSRLPDPIRVLVFLSSFIPLYFIIIWKAWGQSYQILDYYLNPLSILSVKLSWPSAFATVLLISSIVFLIVFTYYYYRKVGTDVTVDDYEERLNLATEYILVYIYPLTVLDYSKFVDVVLFFGLFVMIGIIQSRSNRLYVNPVLAAFGFNYYWVEVDGEEELLITRKSFSAGDKKIWKYPIGKGASIGTHKNND